MTSLNAAKQCSRFLCQQQRVSSLGQRRLGIWFHRDQINLCQSAQIRTACIPALSWKSFVKLLFFAAFQEEGSRVTTSRFTAFFDLFLTLNRWTSVSTQGNLKGRPLSLIWRLQIDRRCILFNLSCNIVAKEIKTWNQHRTFNRKHLFNRLWN